MVDFRRCIIAFAVLALFAGLAGAQGSPLTCVSNVTVTPALRGEGFTEQTGDIAISCTGGSAPAQGTALTCGQHYGVLQHDGDQPPAADQQFVDGPGLQQHLGSLIAHR